ncbi:methyltransferase domain-containing protein [Geomonas azotofigens]|uniref:methyltransferase domain-containing protein n=1 Tax=Geomonas azotofigens TaxID=2843196 RepID=UPI001C0F4D97|nr:methyltransferase domain-containing protein [Geomonas azotofigens]MBU5613873.1 methyltransferase domain-containing protein [Geomonas azotofigens]
MSEQVFENAAAARCAAADREPSPKAGGSCSIEMFPLHQRRALARIHGEILDKFFGCGSPIPAAIEGCTVLNLGCGTGRDVYLASQLVGAEGLVIGIDMRNDEFERYVATQLPGLDGTLFGCEGDEEQLDVARRHVGFHMDCFGFGRPNVEFRYGAPEDLARCGIAAESLDLVVSNCGVNLSPDKERLLNEVYRALKPGGEFYFANIFSSRPIPSGLRMDHEFYAECYGGAQTLEDFSTLLRRVGFRDYLVVSKERLEPSNPRTAAKARGIDFYSMKVRLFKVGDDAEECGESGCLAEYLGTIPELPDEIALDQDHLFITGRPVSISGRVAAILRGTRYARHFRVNGNDTR